MPIKSKWGFPLYGEALFAKVGFEPTGEEQARILRERGRFKLIAGGERSGKSKCAGAEFLLRMAEDMTRVPGEELLYWLVAVDYERTRAEFEYIGEDLRKILRGLETKVVQSKRVDPGVIEVKGMLRVETKSGKDPRTLAMHAPHGIIVCEASQVDLETYMKCQARVAEKRGWIWLAGTFEGSLGWFPSLYQEWGVAGRGGKSYSLPSTSNKFIYPGGAADPEILRLREASGDIFFMERIMGIAAPPKGLVFPEFRGDIHVKEIPYEPGEAVYLWEDPGYGSESAHAIEVVQMRGNQVRVIDEIYERGKITEEIIEICQGKAWWKDVRFLVSDPHYKDQHHAMTSVGEIWLAKAGLVASGERGRVSDRNERIKSFLKVDTMTGEGKLVIAPACKGLLSELGYVPNPFDGQTRVYSWKMDREGNVYGDEPDDRYNHAISALGYGLVEKFGSVTVQGNSQFVMKRFAGGRAAEGGARWSR